MGRGHIDHDMGSHEGFSWYVPSHMRTFLFGCHISFYWFFALEVMRGHDFWTHLQTCTELVDLLPHCVSNLVTCSSYVSNSQKVS